MRVVSALAEEKPGAGQGDGASRYTYYVETLADGKRVYLRRPANLHYGFDFLVCVEGANYAPPGGRRRNYPRHEDLGEDLARKRAEDPSMYRRLYALLKRVYQCHDVTDGELEGLTFSSGLPADHIVKVAKWLFIEQDIRYWNYSGRAMTWGVIPPAEEERRLTPFVKWAGGKTQLLDRLKARQPEGFRRYYEPFVGGGALLLDLCPRDAVINDLNPQLINVYRQLQADPEAVIAVLRALDALPCDNARYLELRAAFNEKIAARVLDAGCAALTIWINKHCYNGLYRVNGSGLFNVPYNNRSGGASMDEDNLREIGTYLRSGGVDIREGDFEAACAGAKAGDFVYFDSPYVPQGGTANFTDYAKEGFRYEDHCRLAECFRRLDAAGVLLMLSNHDVPLVRQLYAGYRIEAVDVKRAINRDAAGRTGREVIITNY